MTTQRPQDATNPFLQLREYDQAGWLDYLSRRFIVGGGLKIVEQAGLVGIASNPSILDEAIAETTDYDAPLWVAEADGDSDKLATEDSSAVAAKPTRRRQRRPFGHGRECVIFDPNPAALKALMGNGERW
jgi:hypothetical protein